MNAPHLVPSLDPALIPLSPLVGAATAYALGRKNRVFSGIIATFAAVVAFILTLKGVADLGPNDVKEARLWEWFAAGEYSFDMTLRLDRLSAVMCLVITGIGSLIHLYSTAYMEEDEGMARFFAYLNLFLFSMLMLVLGGNLLVLFVGWEGVGLCSYLLIGFWYRNVDYCAAGRKAFVVNRIGDAGVLLGTFVLLMTFKTVDFISLREMISDPGVLAPSLAGVCAFVGFCLFVGATGKSAQLPLFVWLPDAMAGPTPVSALIHAATMVTAGIYLFARMWFLFDAAAPDLGLVVVLVAALTAFIAATIAVVQTDIKKVLAYSTVSQLGFMFLAAGAGAYWVALFHVITHAFFKACLFLGAGSVIHGCHHEQDMRQMGGLRRLMPVTFVTYLISTFAIAGIYPFVGFHSKHAILDALAHSTNPLVRLAAPNVVILASITAGLTAFYMTRSLVMTFGGEYLGHAHPHESPSRMTIPLVALAAAALLCGLDVGHLYGPNLAEMLHQNLGSLGDTIHLLVSGLYLEHSLPHYLEGVLPRAHAHPSLEPVASLKASWIGILGVGVAFAMYAKLPSVPSAFANALPFVHRFLLGKYFIDELYRALVVRPLEFLSVVLWRGVDQGVIDGAVNGTGEVLDVAGEFAREAQSGDVRHYALYFCGAAALMIAIYMVL